MKICLSCEGVAATGLDRCTHCGVPLLPTTAAHFPIRRGETEVANPLVGTVIDGKFLIQGVLGRGGMGTVFRASHAVSLMPVALKLLHPRLSSRPAYRRSLLAEARKAGRVVDDHCARVFDVGETDEGTVYLAMELADGEPLDAWVRGRGLAPAVAVDVLVQICRALVAIHRSGLVHRDLSSRNVMVALRNGAPVVKVLDFGIAQSLRVAPGDDSGERAFANPVFSAPEHLAGQPVDARADLYSFGVLAYLLLCGRLPVDQHDARAAARATVAGRLDPLQPLAAVPRRLIRVVQRCLQLDRERRPASAAAVLAELLAVAQGRLRWLPRASVGVFSVALLVALGTLLRATPPFLRLVGSSLAMSEGTLSPEAAPRHLGSAALRTLRAHFGGFAADRIVAEVTRANTLLLQRQLQPVVDRDGMLVLSAAQPDWREVVAGIARACADGAVDFAFVVPGQAVLGSARLLVDDAPPELQLQVDGEAPVRLVRATKVQFQCRDDGGVADLRLLLRLSRGGAQEFPLPASETTFALGEAMASLHGQTASLGPGTIELLARDLAGNDSRAGPIEFVDADFGAPEVVEVTGPAGEATIPFAAGRARMRVRLDGVEPALTMRVRDESGQERQVDSAVASTTQWCELQLRAADGGEPFAAGVYVFAVTDPAGNVTERSLTLAFRSRRPDVAFAVAGELACITGDEIVATTAGCALTFTCNPVFAPASIRLLAAATAPSPPPDAVAMHAAVGSWRVAVASLAPGSYRLVLELEEVGDARAIALREERALTILPPQLGLRLPEVGARFLPPLLQANLLAREGDLLAQGNAISVEAGQRRYLRGWVWYGAAPEALAKQQLLDPAPGDPRLLPSIPLLRGRNVLALELADVLGRPVAVRIGDRVAPVLHQGGRDLWLLADFFDDPAPPQIVGDLLRVEYGHSVRLRLRTPVPFQPADLPNLHLALRGFELPAADLRPVGSGTEVSFLLRFAEWSAASDLADTPRGDYARGITRRLDATFGTPAGPFPLHIDVRTERTTLRELQLAEIGDRPLDPRLGTLALVPVLAPESGVFDDPVPADEPARSLFRAQPVIAVRNCADFFLQDREFTLGEYAILLARLPLEPTERGGLWHTDDPLGAARLEPANMVPLAWRGDAAAFAAAAAAEPEGALTGVDFFQAYAATRLLGFVVAGDPGLFRLPLGCELELAAFGGRSPGAARQGAVAQGGRVRTEPWRDPAAPTPAGPSAAYESRCGDVVGSLPGRPIHGLDFGVREWVLDLPQGIDSAAESLLREWIADRERHVQRALELAGARQAPADLRGLLTPDLQGFVGSYGVVRGTPYGERGALLGADGRSVWIAGLDYLPAAVPGVVRTEQLRRDGRDLMPGRIDPRLLRTGFRVMGGAVFLERVRGR